MTPYPMSKTTFYDLLNSIKNDNSKAYNFNEQRGGKTIEKFS